MTTDKQTQKETYEAPSMEVIKMENEGNRGKQRRLQPRSNEILL